MVAWRATLDSVLVRIEKSLVEFPEYPGLHEDRGIIKALVGQREEAVAEARWLGQWGCRPSPPQDRLARRPRPDLRAARPDGLGVRGDRAGRGGAVTDYRALPEA
jgi:hypothetical protein